MKKSIYTLIGIVIWSVIFRLMVHILEISEIDVLMGCCALLMTKIIYIENNKKDNKKDN